MNVGAPSSMDVYGSISLTFDEPIARFDSAAIHLDVYKRQVRGCAISVS